MKMEKSTDTITDNGISLPVYGLQFTGATLRDVFAVIALSSIIKMEEISRTYEYKLIDAKLAYGYADAMMTARKDGAV